MNKNYKLLLSASAALLTAVGAVALSPVEKMAGSLRSAEVRQQSNLPASSGIMAPPTETAQQKDVAPRLSGLKRESMKWRYRPLRGLSRRFSM